ncbi:MAG TPA: hypothetical protein VLQ76_03515, partial [Bacteroidales bacterium]|nr:hypothetical protein [Bacteroidales bacterium]
MVYIPPAGGQHPEIFVHLDTYDKDIPGKRMTLFFHKRLGAYDLRLPPERFLASGIDEMNELIF